MTSLYASGAIVLYLLSFGYQVVRLRKQRPVPTPLLQALTALAIALHGLAVADFLFIEEGLDLSLLNLIK